MLKLYGGLLLAVVSSLLLFSRIYDISTQQPHLLYPQEEAFLSQLFALADGSMPLSQLPVASLPLNQLAIPDETRALLQQGGTAVLQDKAQAFYFYRQNPAEPSQITIVGPIDYPESPLDRQPVHWQLLPYALLALALLLICWPLYLDIKKLQAFCARVSRVDFGTTASITRLTMLGSIGNTMADMAQKLAFHRNQQRDFINAVSHDFLTPLARMKFTLAMGRSAQGEAITDTFESLDEDLTELEQLIDEFLSHAELTQYRPSEQRQRFSGRQLVADCFAKFQPLVSVTLEIAGEADDIVQDKAGFERIMQNLISNAARYANSRVRVSLNGEKNLLVQVEDDGPGFIAADTDSLLAAFHQGELSAHQLYQGVGLGLSTVALLCRHLSAKVTLGRSQTLGGACVTLEFPSAP